MTATSDTVGLVKVNCSARWEHDQPAYLLNITGRVRVGKYVIIDHLAVDRQDLRNDAALLQKDTHRYITFTGTLVAEGMAAVERERVDQDVKVDVEFTSSFSRAIPYSPPRGADQTWLAGPVVWNLAWCSGRTWARSDWIKLVDSLGFGQTELFELPVAQFTQDEMFQAALDHLRKAVKANRDHDYDITVIECRKATESLARHASEGPNTKRGFDLLLERAFGGDELRRNAVNGIIHALTNHAHELARHAHYPPIQATREEAEFALAAHVRLMSMLARAVDARAKRGHT